MRKAGIDVTVGVMEQECRYLNRRFITFHTQHRPYIILKWAQTPDGVIGKLGGEPLLISNPATLRHSHHQRATSSAILVGWRTNENDHPALTTRHYSGPDPVRIVYDSHNQKLMVNGQWSTPKGSRAASENEVAMVNGIPDLLDDLYNRGLQSLLVEGGAATHRQFLDLDLWDEIHQEIGANTLNAQFIYAPDISHLKPHHTIRMGTHQINIYINK